MRLVPRRGTEDMSLACRQLFLFMLAVMLPFTRHQCMGFVSADSRPQARSQKMDCIHIGGWPSIDEYGL